MSTHTPTASDNPITRATKASVRRPTTKLPVAEQILAVADYPGTYDIARNVATCMREAGLDGGDFNPAELTVVKLASRAAASVPDTITTLANGLWGVVAKRIALSTRDMQRYDGEQIPGRPPSADQLDSFTKRLHACDGLLAQMQHTHMRAAVMHARSVGLLKPGVTPDYAHPDPRHRVIGDGTISRPVTGVVRIVCPITGKFLNIGSRATHPSRARVQDFSRNEGEDGKALKGINHVAYHVTTEHGPIILGTKATLGAEQWAALDLMDALGEIAGDGIHYVLHDRVHNGWLVDYLYRQWRYLVINKNYGRPVNDKRTNDGELSIASLMQERAMRLAAEHSADPKNAPILQHLTAYAARQYADSGQPLPVGTSLYPTTSGYDLVNGRYWDMGSAIHDTATGPCRHPLYSDDGGLWQVDIGEDGYLVKIDHCPSLQADPGTGKHGHTLRTQWLVTCTRHGDFTHETLWEPESKRWTQADARKDSSPLNPLTATRPLSRSDDLDPDNRRFAQIANARNHVEGLFSWMKRYGYLNTRAAAYTFEGQELDFLSLAVVRNAITWRRSRM